MAKELKMEFHPDFLKDLDQISRNDPKAADALREMLANMRQAIEGVNSGRFKSFDEGVEAITGQRPQKLGDDDDDDG
jgi:hypothetical protein